MISMPAGSSNRHIPCVALVCSLLLLLSRCSGGHPEVGAMDAAATDAAARASLDSAHMLLRQGQLDGSERIARRVLDELGTGPRWSSLRQKALSALGQVQQERAAPDSAAKLYAEGLRIATAAGDTSGVGGMWLNIGTARQLQGDYQGALEAGLEALRYKEMAGDQRGQARALHNLSLLYWRQNDLPAAMSMLQRSIAIKREHDSLGVANSLNGLAVLLMEADRPDTALQVLRESIRLARVHGPGQLVDAQYSNMGLAYEALHKPDSAMLMYRQSMAGGDGISVIRGLYGIGELLMAEGKNAEARAPLDSSLALALERGWPEDIKEAHLSVARQREAVGDAASALFHYKAHHALGDSLMNAAKDAAMNDLRMRYDTERKERENQQLRTAKLFSEMRAERNRWAAIGIGILALVVALLAWALVMRNRHKAALREADLEQQALRLQMDPHFLFNALNTVPGLYAAGDAAAADDHVGHLSRFLRMVLETSRRRAVPVAQELQLVEHYLRISASRWPGTLTWDVHVMPGLQVERAGMPPMLLQPLVENAVEHGLGGTNGGHVEIKVGQQGELLMIDVKDNGQGRQAAGMRPSRHQGRSLGLGLVRQRIALFDRRAPRNAVQVLDDTDEQGRPAGTTVRLQFHSKPLAEHAAHSDRG